MAPPEKADRYPNYVLGVLTAAYVFNYLDRQILAVLLEPIKKDLAVSDTAMGFLTGTAFAIFYATAGIPVARLADRWVRRNVLAMGLTVWSAMTVACGAVGAYWQLALCRIGVGVGEAGGVPPSHSILSDYFPPERRATVFGLYAVAPLIGSALGNGIGGWLAGEIGWRGTFVAVGVPGIVLAALVMLTVREPERGRFDPPKLRAEPDPDTREVFRFLWSRRTFRLIAPALGFATFAGLGMGMWSPTFLMRVHGMSVAETGLFLATVSAPAGAIGTVVGGWAADRLGRRDVRWYAWLPAITLLAALPFQAAQLLIDDRWLALAAFVPAGLIGGVFASPSYAVVQNIARPQMRAMASAILLLFLNLIGLGGGPQAVGILNDVLRPSFGDESIRYSLLLIKVATLLAAFLFWRASKSITADLADTPQSS
ncbi:MAG: MFS transporter [Candidatus Binatia bacterium]|nr:MFS transporter [Candidatus Binatia bacterium]